MRIAMLDDDGEDIFIIRKAISKRSNNISFHGFCYSEMFFRWLENDAQIEPDLLLLDINMPRADGMKVLNKLKASELWQNIPVFMLTTSKLAADRERFLSAGADAFFTKSATILETRTLIGDIISRLNQTRMAS